MKKCLVLILPHVIRTLYIFCNCETKIIDINFYWNLKLKFTIFENSAYEYYPFSLESIQVWCQFGVSMVPFFLQYWASWYQFGSVLVWIWFLLENENWNQNLSLTVKWNMKLEPIKTIKTLEISWNYTNYSHHFEVSAFIQHSPWILSSTTHKPQ
jgi:hypothetical protein